MSDDPPDLSWDEILDALNAMAPRDCRTCTQLVSGWCRHPRRLDSRTGFLQWQLATGAHRVNYRTLGRWVELSVWPADPCPGWTRRP